MTKFQALANMYRAFVIVIASLGIGMVSTLILLTVSAFVIAGPDGDKWFSWFLGDSGYKFALSTLILGLVAIPFVKRAKLRLV